MLAQPRKTGLLDLYSLFWQNLTLPGLTQAHPRPGRLQESPIMAKHGHMHSGASQALLPFQQGTVVKCSCCCAGGEGSQAEQERHLLVLEQRERVF